ncbi:MAG: sigma-54 dependent transcriptional regulator, partial [candidate division KSB1 bacterium]|nr:sigma-54 dependent transcriptional regulator [candidate division KSB1 bacterium]
MARILICDDDTAGLTAMGGGLRHAGHEVVLVSDTEAASEALKQNEFDLVVCDLMFPQKEDGLETVRSSKSQSYKPSVLVITAFAATENVVEAMKAGADDFIAKGFSIAELQEKVQKLQELREKEQWLQIENHLAKEKIRREFGDYEIIGTSPAIQEMIKKIDRIAASGKTTCLIQGETGSGKELVARAIHHKSPRNKGPLVVINCASIPENLIESELFGHERGAFTTALTTQKGKFELANGGIVFLDEIAELSLGAQVKLLRILEEDQFCRVGGHKPITTDVMVIAATNKDLTYEVRKGRFREDIYYRLNVVKIEVPPLREHPEDIPLLVNHFLKRLNQQKGRDLTMSEAALQVLMKYPFPGNVRELKNILENASVMTEGSIIGPSDLPINRENYKISKSDFSMDESSLSEAVKEFEKEFLIKYLRENDWS